MGVVAETIGLVGVDSNTLRNVAFGVTIATYVGQSVHSVEEEEIGVKTRFGKVSKYKFGKRKGQLKIAKPGGHFRLWGVQNIKKVEVNERSSDLQDLIVELQKREGSDVKEQYIVRSSIDWHVDPSGDNPYLALYETSTLNETVTNMCLNGLRDACQGMTYEAVSDEDAMLDKIKTECGYDEKLLAFGAVLTALHLRTIARSGEEILAESIGKQRGGKVGALIGILTASRAAHLNAIQE